MRISLSTWLLAGWIAAAFFSAGSAASTFADEGSVLRRSAGQGANSVVESRITSDETEVNEPSLANEPSGVIEPNLPSSLGPTFVQEAEVGSGVMLTESNDSTDDLPTSVGSDFYTATERGAGLIGGGELLYMRLYETGGAFDMGFAPAYRAWIGYQNTDGLGGRIRYWNFNHTKVFSDRRDLFHDEFSTLDGEVTQQVDYYSWNFLVSGGVRQVETRSNYERLGPPFNLGSQHGFSGAGLTFAVTATRDLNSSGSFRFVAGARWSSLFGNTREGSILTPGPIPTSRNTTMNTMELQAGPQFVRELDHGALLMISGGVETQTWNDIPGPLNEGVALLGFSGSISILR